MSDARFESWAVLELMGHRRLAGYLTEVDLAGGRFLRIDVPMADGTMATQLYSPAAVYAITPASEEIAYVVARQNQPQPLHYFELRQLQSPQSTEPEGELDHSF